MPLTFGQAKSLDDITLDDVLKHPIWLWVWETGQEGAPGQDETWQQPVTSTSDVTDELKEPIISFHVKGTGIYGSGSYRPEDDKLFGMALWVDGRWQLLSAVSLQTPLTFVAIPRIRGQANVEYVCTDLRADEAHRAA